MLDKEQLVTLFDRLGTPAAGRTLIIKARIEAPVRDVKSYNDNVITHMASRKMGQDVAIRTESRHVEFAAAVNHEHDAKVLEFYTQPCKLDLELVDEATGEIHFITHFPDFLVIREDGFTLEEWKSEVKLQRLADKQPWRYQRDEDGNWYSPQIERQLADQGIRYRIYSNASVPRKRVENLLHLADYHHPGALPCDETELARLRAALAEHSALYVYDLMSAPFGFASDFLLKAVADRLVVADLDNEPLTEPRRARLFRDEALREFMSAHVISSGVSWMNNFAFQIEKGTRFAFDGNELEITLVGEKEIICTKGNQTLTLTRDWLESTFESGGLCILEQAPTEAPDFARFSEQELQSALQRKAALESNDDCAFSARHMQRLRGLATTAIANGANEVFALVPRHKDKGNRTARLNDSQLRLMQEVFQEHWSNHRAPNITACHSYLIDACNKEQIRPPSYPTFAKFIKKNQTSADIKARYGKRMAYQLDSYIEVLCADTPKHGSRPFQYVHIDHTQLDIEVISSRTGKPLKRPWLTLAVDAWSRRILAIYLTFEAPSYRSVMMVMRDMVKRYMRLPEFIVVDNGKDFMSSAFDCLLQALGVHLRFRPAGRPRHGAVLERLFGMLQSEYVHNLAGNTKVTKNVRMATGKHLPVNFAEWTLEHLYYGISYWAGEFYDTTVHPVLDLSPREAFQKGMRELGSRPHKMLQMNQDFKIATCPPVDRKGTRNVHPQSGVKVGGYLYWSPEFKSAQIAGKELPVRYDPWDISTVYVLYKERWIRATCNNLLGLGQLNEAERKAISEEYNKRNNKKLDSEVSPQKLSEFLSTFTPEGALATAFEQHAENKKLYNSLELGSVTPPAPPKISSLNVESNSAAEKQHVIRSYSHQPTAPQPEASAPQTFPDLETF